MKIVNAIYIYVVNVLINLYDNDNFNEILIKY